MRIIGGAFRGRRLASVGRGDAAAHLRPTSDRVRESLFNVLANAHADRLDDARVLDLFAGTGALGLEAVSRGAAHVTFVENGRTAQKLLRENIRLCSAEDMTQTLPRDARKPGPAPAPVTLVVLDPPYGKGIGEQALAAAIAQGWIAHDALIVWEESADITPPYGLTQIDERRYGDTFIRLLEYTQP
ncbi:MAG: 16S rRNA (guanine(966)-N(2))-methyltransferase RsmD [Roseovarius sp.]|uniref:16S rRNA (guanine(966)-N(2))-methyltransferase RsmD n=1 Tax=Roseovarius sp. TaxID=1486281 RepID=UPI0032EFB272